MKEPMSKPNAGKSGLKNKLYSQGRSKIKRKGMKSGAMAKNLHRPG